MNNKISKKIYKTNLKKSAEEKKATSHFLNTDNKPSLTDTERGTL